MYHYTQILTVYSQYFRELWEAKPEHDAYDRIIEY